MKKLVFLLFFIASTAFATEPSLPNNVQMFAPNGSLVDTLSVNSSTYNLSDNLMYSYYSGSGTCFVRLMSTSAKGSFTRVAVANTTWLTYGKNPSTPFLNLSGCVAGVLRRQ